MIKKLLLILFISLAHHGYSSGQVIIPASKDGKWGYIDLYGNIAIPFQYHDAHLFFDNRARVQVNNKWGYINEAGETVIPIQYEECDNFNKYKAIVKKNGKWGVINKEGKALIQIRYDSIIHHYYKNSDFYTVRLNEKYGGYYHNKLTVPIEYDQVEAWYSNPYIITYKDNRYGLCDSTGQIKIPTILDDDPYSMKNNQRVSSQGKYGFIDSLANITVPIIYSECSSFFKEGLTPMKRNGKYGYIDAEGNEVIKPKYSYASQFSNGYASVSSQNSSMYINKAGENVFNKEFCYTNSFSEGIALVIDFDGFNHCIDTLGNPLFDIPKDISLYHKFENGFIRFYYDKDNTHFGLMNKKGEIVLNAEFDHIRTFNSNYIKVTKGDSSAIYNSLGKLVSKFYDETDFENPPFSHDLIRVKREGKYGYIDTTTYQEVIEAKYDSCSKYLYSKTDLIQVCLNDKWGYINRTGEVIVPIIYTQIKKIDNASAAAKLNGKWGEISKTGETLVPFIYSEIGWFHNGLASAKYKGKWGIIDTKNRRRVNFEYDEIRREFKVLNSLDIDELREFKIIIIGSLHCNKKQEEE